MKNEIIIKPAFGIEWLHGKILLGEPRNKLNGSGLVLETINRSAYMFQGDIRVDFDTTDAVEFVEVRGGLNGELHPVFDGISLFEAEASDVVNLLKEKYIVDERENGYSYVISDLDLALWRERTEKDVEQFMKEMEADGILPENNPDVEVEWKLAKYFSAVSIGKKGYFMR